MSDIEGINEGSVSGSCTECSECFVMSGNKRTKVNQKYIKNKGKMKPKHEKYTERNSGIMQKTLDTKHDSLKHIKAIENNLVDEQEGTIVPISCNCPCIKSYIKLINTLEMCNCSTKTLKFNKTVANQNDLIESERQCFTARKKEPRLKKWKGTLKIITSSISLPFNMLKIRTNKKTDHLKAKPKYEKIFNDQQFISGNGDLQYNNTDLNKLGASEIPDEKFTSQKDVTEDQNHSSMSMDRIFSLCKRNNIQGPHEADDETENSADNKPSNNFKETRSLTKQEMSENVAIQHRNEFHQTHSEIFSNLKNDQLNPTNIKPIPNKKSDNVLSTLTEMCEIPRKEELQSKLRGKLRCNLIQKFNSLGSSQRRYAMGVRNHSNHTLKECIDRLLADMEYKSGSCVRLHKGLVCSSEGANLQKSDVWTDGMNIPKEISNLKQLLKDKILLHQQECETSLHPSSTSCQINTRIKSEKVKFQEIIKSYYDIMNDLETLCEKQDSNQSLKKNISENFIHLDNSANECIQPLFEERFEKILKSTSKSKLTSCNENVIEPIAEKNDKGDITYSKQHFIHKNTNISDKEEILTLDSGDSVQDTKISRFQSAAIETTNNTKKTECKIQSSVNKKSTRTKRRATKAWQENQFTESDTTQSPNA